jgi:hypothetical protein
MSYSVCVSCQNMVPQYEKYCDSCLSEHPELRQVDDYWRNPVNASESPVALVDILWSCHKGHKSFSPEKPTECPECAGKGEHA